MSMFRDCRTVPLVSRVCESTLCYESQRRPKQAIHCIQSTVVQQHAEPQTRSRQILQSSHQVYRLTQTGTPAGPGLSQQTSPLSHASQSRHPMTCILPLQARDGRTIMSVQCCPRTVVHLNFNPSPQSGNDGSVQVNTTRP